jgi:hypothetical protein
VQGDADLSQMIDAGCPAAALTSRLNRWQQEADQHSNDRNHDKQLNEREARIALPGRSHLCVL